MIFVLLAISSTSFAGMHIIHSRNPTAINGYIRPEKNPTGIKAFTFPDKNPSKATRNMPPYTADAKKNANHDMNSFKSGQHK